MINKLKILKAVIAITAISFQYSAIASKCPEIAQNWRIEKIKTGNIAIGSERDDLTNQTIITARNLENDYLEEFRLSTDYSLNKQGGQAMFASLKMAFALEYPVKFQNSKNVNDCRVFDSITIEKYSDNNDVAKRK